MSLAALDAGESKWSLAYEHRNNIDTSRLIDHESSYLEPLFYRKVMCCTNHEKIQRGFFQKVSSFKEKMSFGSFQN